MTEVSQEQVVGPPEEDTPKGDSLQARMRRRAGELQQRTTEMFPVPRWEDMLAVELRVIGWKRIEKIAEQHTRQPAELQTLYTAADEIIAATVNFWELDEDGAKASVVDPPTSWRVIASGVLDLPEEVTDRQALIALVGEINVVPFEYRYRRWMQGQDTGISEQVVRDFK